MDKKLALTLFAAVLAIFSFAAAAVAQDLEVAVKEVEPFPYLAIAHQGPYTDMGTVIGQLIGAMQTQGLFAQIRGPLVGVYYDSPANTAPAKLSWEVGFIVTSQTTAEVPLMKKTWDHRTVAAATHVGPYDQSGAFIAKMMSWLAGHGYAAAGPILERYLDQNPSAVDPQKLRTEIWIPIAKR